MNRKKRREAGAFAIEAILSLTTFIMVIVALMMGAMLIRAQASMQYALNQTAKEISGYFYLLDKFGIASILSGQETNTAAETVDKFNSSIQHVIDFSGSLEEEGQALQETGENAVSGNLTEADYERIKNIGNDAEAIKAELIQIKNDLNELAGGDKKLMFKSILQVFSRTLINKSFSYFVAPLVCEALAPKYLTSGDLQKYYNTSGIHDIDFSGSEILADGRTINLVVTYKVNASKLTLGFYKKDLVFRQIATTAAWVRPNSSGSLVSLEKICANFDEEYAAAHSISVEENTPPETTDTSEGEASTTASDDSTDTSDSTTDTVTTASDDDEETTTSSAGAATTDSSTDSDTTSSTSDTGSSSSTTTTSTTRATTTTAPLPDDITGDLRDYVNSLSRNQRNVFLNAYNIYGGSLLTVLKDCANVQKAVQYVGKYNNEFASLLVANGPDAFRAFDKLDSPSRITLLHSRDFAPDSETAAKLIEMILDGNLSNLTRQNIADAKKAVEEAQAELEAETPERTTPSEQETQYKGNATRQYAVTENLPAAKQKYDYNESSGLFGVKGKGARNIVCDDPNTTAREFYETFAYGGEETPIYGNKNGQRVQIGLMSKLSDGTVISWRDVSSSDGSPAVEINAKNSTNRGNLKDYQKIHFVK